MVFWKYIKKTERKKLTIDPELGGVKGRGSASYQGGSSNVGNNHLDSGSEPHVDLQVNTLKGCIKKWKWKFVVSNFVSRWKNKRRKVKWCLPADGRPTPALSHQNRNGTMYWVGLSAFPFKTSMVPSGNLPTSSLYATFWR